LAGGHKERLSINSLQNFRPMPMTCFTQGQLQAIADALGDTNDGLTGSEIEHLLATCGIADVDPAQTKRHRLYNAFVQEQNQRQDRTHILGFIRHAMKPERFARFYERFPEGERPESPAALTERSVRATLVEELRKALIEAIELSKTMVAEDEAAPINDQTYVYAVEVLAPLIIVMELPVPLILPLQNGGIGAEWHDHGMNIELRFRSPYHIYAVLEDAQGAIQPFYGRDPFLVQTLAALREVSTRAVGRESRDAS